MPLKPFAPAKYVVRLAEDRMPDGDIGLVADPVQFATLPIDQLALVPDSVGRAMVGRESPDHAAGDDTDQRMIAQALAKVAHFPASAGQEQLFDPSALGRHEFVDFFRLVFQRLDLFGM